MRQYTSALWVTMVLVEMVDDIVTADSFKKVKTLDNNPDRFCIFS